MKFTATLITLLLSLSVFADHHAEATYKAVPGKTKIKWKGTKVTGSHDGHIMLKSGDLTFEKGKWTKGKFVIDMTSITVDDIKNAEYNKKLVNHLKNDDFFSVKTFKTAMLEVTQVKYKKNGKFKASGNLKIKDISKPISFKGELKMKDKKVKMNSKLKIDRTLYNVKYGSGKFFENLGDKMIHDEFVLNVKLTAKK